MKFNNFRYKFMELRNSKVTWTVSCSKQNTWKEIKKITTLADEKKSKVFSSIEICTIYLRLSFFVLFRLKVNISSYFFYWAIKTNYQDFRSNYVLAFHNASVDSFLNLFKSQTVCTSGRFGLHNQNPCEV